MPEQSVAHMVFFTLKDPSAVAIEHLLKSCQQHLTDHAGVTHFSVGPRGEEFTRPVNNQSYHAGLHVVFENKQAHDEYQVHPRHLAFIEENKASWEKVEIFDSYV